MSSESHKANHVDVKYGGRESYKADHQYHLNIVYDDNSHAQISVVIIS